MEQLFRYKSHGHSKSEFLLPWIPTTLQTLQRESVLFALHKLNGSAGSSIPPAATISSIIGPYKLELSN